MQWTHPGMVSRGRYNHRENRTWLAFFKTESESNCRWAYYFFREDCAPSSIDVILTDQSNLVLDSSVRPSLDPAIKHHITFCKLNLNIPFPSKFTGRVFHYCYAQEILVKVLVQKSSWADKLRNVSNPTQQLGLLDRTVLKILIIFSRTGKKLSVHPNLPGFPRTPKFGLESTAKHTKNTKKKKIWEWGQSQFRGKWIENKHNDTKMLRQSISIVWVKSSRTPPLTQGVPKVSVLGPLLFIVYINDLESGVKSKINFFADDTSLYAVVRSFYFGGWAPTRSRYNHWIDKSMENDFDPITPAKEIVFSQNPAKVFHPPFFQWLWGETCQQTQRATLILNPKLNLTAHIKDYPTRVIARKRKINTVIHRG